MIIISKVLAVYSCSSIRLLPVLFCSRGWLLIEWVDSMMRDLTAVSFPLHVTFSSVVRPAVLAYQPDDK